MRVVFALAALVAATGSAAAAGVLGNVVLTRDTRDPIAVWQASEEIYTLIGNGAARRDVDARLAHDALGALRRVLPGLRGSSGTLTLRIVYNKMTPNGLDYKVFTLAGALDYAVVRAPVRDLLHNRDRWEGLPERGAVPRWIRYDAVGRLPGQ